MGRHKKIASAQVIVGVEYGRRRQGEVTVRTDYVYIGGGGVRGNRRRVPCGVDVAELWDTLLDEVLIVLERTSQVELVIRDEMPEDVHEMLALIGRIVMHEASRAREGAVGKVRVS